MPTLHDCLNEFLSIERAASTQNNYQKTLTRLLDILGHDRDIADVRYTDLVAYLQYRRRQRAVPIKASSLAQFVQIYTRFFRWTIERGYIVESPVRDSLAADGAREGPPRKRWEAAKREKRKVIPFEEFL